MSRASLLLAAVGVVLSFPIRASADAPAPKKPPPARAPHRPSTAIFVAGLAFELGGRRFAYTDAITANARDYGIFGAPMPVGFLEVYPAAGTTIPVLRDLGLTGSFARAVGINSTTSDGTLLGTTWMRASGALRLRVRPGGVRGPMLGVNGGLAATSFTFYAPALAGAVPAVSYVALRGGLDARVPFWRMALLLEGGYDGALSAGKVHERFRGAQVGGIDGGAGLAVALAGGFEARLTGHYTRYFYSFDPVPGDAYVAGGALDELFGFGVGVAYAY